MRRQLLLLLSALCLLGAVSTRGALVIVQNTNNAGSGSLRQAVLAASSGDTILFSTNLAGQTIRLTSGEIVLSNSITLDGSGQLSGITISANKASRIFTVTNNASVRLDTLTLRDGLAGSAGGGAIYNWSTNLVLNRCTLSFNSSSNGNGGAIYTAGYMALNQCTVASNYAATGGAAYIKNGGILRVNQSTVAGNSAVTAGGVYNLEVLDYTNAIIAMNTGGAGADITLAGCCGRGDRQGVNIIQNISGSSSFPYTGTGVVINANPLLAALGDFGGLTPTMPPLVGSPAIDGCTNGTSFTADQRGLARPVDGDGNGSAIADIGAVELIFPVLNVSPETAQSAYRGYAQPFNVTNFGYLLSNSGPVPLDWALNVSSNWLTPDFTSGTLAAGASTVVNLAVNDNAYQLDYSIPPNATWTNTLAFVNLTGGQSPLQRDVTLDYYPPVNGGGVVLWGSSPSAPAFVPGLFRISLEPAGALGSGAGWRAVNGFPNTNWVQDTANWYYPVSPSAAIEFLPVPGFSTPANQPVNVNPALPAVITGSYTPLPPAVLFNAQMLTNGALRLSLSSSTGTVYSIQRSTNLIDWSGTQTLTNFTGTNIFTNLPAPNSASGFFRARQTQ